MLAAKATNCISQIQKNDNSFTFSTIDGETKVGYIVSLKITTPKNYSLAAVAGSVGIKSEICVLLTTHNRSRRAQCHPRIGA